MHYFASIVNLNQVIFVIQLLALNLFLVLPHNPDVQRKPRLQQ